MLCPSPDTAVRPPGVLKEGLTSFGGLQGRSSVTREQGSLGARGSVKARQHLGVSELQEDRVGTCWPFLTLRVS